MEVNPPWERQPDESSPAWEARKIYLHMGPGRSIERVHQEVGKNTRLIAKWSVRWQWVKSAAALDAHLDKQASNAAMTKKVADQVAESERWALRDDEGPELVYRRFLDSHQDIEDFVKLVKETPPADAKERARVASTKATMIRSFVALAPLATLARLEMASRRAQRGQLGPNGAGGPNGGGGPNGPAEKVPGLTLAMLKLFNEMTEAHKAKTGDPVNEDDLD